MSKTCVKVARGLLLFDAQIQAGTLDRAGFLKTVGVTDSALRKAADQLGAVGASPGLRFFESSTKKISFGPGAGLVLGISVGTGSLRGALFDANGRMYHPHPGRALHGQLALDPEKLLARIRDVATSVMTPALGNRRLLVDDIENDVVGRHLPFLGVAVAWAAPLNRLKMPFGTALASDEWRDGQSLNERVAQGLKLPGKWSHALNDAHASAIAVAFDQTRDPGHVKAQYPELAIVLRLAGGVGGAIIVVEPPEEDLKWGRTSGFPRSILIAGRDQFAGELGHVPLEQAVIDGCNERARDGLLGDLVAQRCSCVSSSKPVPHHLEALAGTSAVAHRIASDQPECNVVEAIRANPKSEIHKRALEDVGVLVAHALLGPVAMLNPATITLTGSLAFDSVSGTLGTRLAKARVLGNPPVVSVIDPMQAKYSAARGAALAVLRRHVHRELPTLLGKAQDESAELVRKLTLPISRLPW